MARPRVFEPGEKATINIFLPQKMKDAVIRLARDRDMNPSAFVRELIQREIRKKEEGEAFHAAGSKKTSPG